MNENYYVLGHTVPMDFNGRGRFDISSPSFFMGAYGEHKNIGMVPARNPQRMGDFTEDQQAWFDENWSMTSSLDNLSEAKKQEELAILKEAEEETSILDDITSFFGGVTEVVSGAADTVLSLAKYAPAALDIYKSYKILSSDDPAVQNLLTGSVAAMAAKSSSTEVDANFTAAQKELESKRNLALAAENKELEEKYNELITLTKAMKTEVDAARSAKGASLDGSLGTGSGSSSGKILGMDTNTALIIGAVAVGFGFFMMSKKN